MNFIKEVKQRVDIIEVARNYGIEINRANKAICPFHKEKTASLSFSPQKQIWKCFGCGEGGDAISLVAKLLNVNNYESAKSINHHFNLGLDNSQTTRLEINEYKQKTERNNRLKKWRLEAFVILTDYLHLLWKFEDLKNPNIDLYAEALKEKHKVQYFINMLIEGTEEDWIWLKNKENKYIQNCKKGGSN